ncbi:hypothetical protein ACYULU_06300 [Breznakiellaceae bacterium SP9]
MQEQIIDAAAVAEFVQNRFHDGKVRVWETAGNITLTPFEGAHTFSRETDAEITVNPYRSTAEEKRKRDAADLAYINENAERLNNEMSDVLRYQIEYKN